MQSITSDEHTLPDHSDRLDKYPALAALGLTAVDLEELARQGFVCAERRGRRTYFKLRFRSGGRQIVRYIGDAERAALVQAELDRLQAETKSLRELKVLTKIANQMLREAKSTIEPSLHTEGFAFHGLAIRRPRTRREANRSQTNS